MSRFRYPPCNMNPTTERPFSRHKWEIKDALRVKINQHGDPVYIERIVCTRCGLNDPKVVTH